VNFIVIRVANTFLTRGERSITHSHFAQMVAPPPRKRTKKGGKDGNQGTEDGKDGNQETEDGNRVTKDDILIPADTNAEWREKFNEKINKELKSIKEKGATSVLLEDEFRAIVNYLLEVQKSGSNDNGTVHGGDTNPSNGTTNEESTRRRTKIFFYLVAF